MSSAIEVIKLFDGRTYVRIVSAECMESQGIVCRNEELVAELSKLIKRIERDVLLEEI